MGVSLVLPSISARRMLRSHWRSVKGASFAIAYRRLASRLRHAQAIGALMLA